MQNITFAMSKSIIQSIFVSIMSFKYFIFRDPFREKSGSFKGPLTKLFI